MKGKLVNSQIALPIEVRKSLLDIKHAYGKVYGEKSKRAYNGQGRTPSHSHKFNMVVKVLPNISEMLIDWQVALECLNPDKVADGCVSINQELIPITLEAIGYVPNKKLTKSLKLTIMVVSAISSGEDFTKPSNLLHLKTFLNLLSSYNDSGKAGNANLETITSYLLWRVAIDCRLNQGHRAN